MAGTTPEQALDHYIERTRVALSCVADVVAFASDRAQGELRTLTLYAVGQARPNLLRLRTHGGSGELLLNIAEQFNIIHRPDAISRLNFDIWTAFYHYLILDRLNQEIVAYHWEPEGRSPVVWPHLHMPAANPIVLPQPSGSPLAETKTHLSKLHFPTGRESIEDIVELLITDFDVDPLRAEWQAILLQAREHDARR